MGIIEIVIGVVLYIQFCGFIFGLWLADRIKRSE